MIEIKDSIKSGICWHSRTHYIYSDIAGFELICNC